MSCYYAVIDLEMCIVPEAFRTKEFNHTHEIIQIGAVLLDEQYQYIDRFSLYVCPTMGRIDSFIENLTGITEDDIKDAMELPEALDAFVEWLPKNAEVYGVSWSTSDSHQLKYEMEGKNIDNPTIKTMVLERWIDAQKLFGKIIKKRKSMSLEQALILSDIEVEGTAHDGLADAINTAKLFTKMKTEPEFKVNKFYEEAQKEEPNHLAVSIGDLLKNIHVE